MRFRVLGPLGASETLRRRVFSPARGTWRFRNTAQACVFTCPGHLALREHCAGVRSRLPGPLGPSQTLRRRAFFACPGHLALQEHCAGVRFRLPGPPGASETPRRRAFSPARAAWRFRNTAKACVFAYPGRLALQKHCTGVRFRLPGLLKSSEALRGPVHTNLPFEITVQNHSSK